MSSHVVVKTLKFCTKSKDNLILALDILKVPYVIEGKSIVVDRNTVDIYADAMCMNVKSNNARGFALFDRVNKKIAEIEAQIRTQEIERNAEAQKQAALDAEMYRVRQLKSEQERLAYERRKLELEQQSFVEAKKQAIIAKAKAKGYSVEERIENGTVKLKLIKRLY